jgi:hypothetical protein
VFEAVAGQVLTSGNREGQAAHLLLHAPGGDVETLGVTPTYFHVLGQSILGRDFRRDDNQPGAEAVVIISDRLWSRAFGRRTDVIGTLAPAAPFPVRIIGVAPPGFEGVRRGERTDVWIPAALAARLSPAAATTNPEGGLTLLIGRLRPGQTPEAARQQLLDLVELPPGAPANYRSEYMEKIQVVRVADVFGTPSSQTIVARRWSRSGLGRACAPWQLRDTHGTRPRPL